MKTNFARHVIVADIGGTHARFARASITDFKIDCVSLYACLDFKNIADAIRSYQETHELTGIEFVAVAIACPVRGDQVRMTNLNWQFSRSAVQRDLKLKGLWIMNDFEALAMALPYLNTNDFLQIGTGSVLNEAPAVVLGAGTGFGVSYLIPHEDRLIPIASEAGHMDWAPLDERDWFIKGFLSKRFGRVSLERLLSGPGIENIYDALLAFEMKPIHSLPAADIATRALSGTCSLALHTIQYFFSILGSVAGDFALMLNALGGVYLAGGVVPKLLPMLDPVQFRERFTAKGRFSQWTHDIPTFVITAKDPGLIGAAAYIKQLGVKHVQASICY